MDQNQNVIQPNKTANILVIEGVEPDGTPFVLTGDETEVVEVPAGKTMTPDVVYKSPPEEGSYPGN